MTKKEYYLQQFEKIDQGFASWNWASALLFPLWAAYRKLYLWSCLSALLSVLFTVAYTICSLKMCNLLFESETPKIVLWIMIIILPLIVILAGGFLGNRLYYCTVKNRIKDGYPLYEKYKPTSGALVLIYCLAWIIAPILAAFCLLIVWYAEKRAVGKIRKQVPYFEFEISKANIEKLL